VPGKHPGLRLYRWMPWLHDMQAENWLQSFAKVCQSAKKVYE
jgi:hypothetical protein